MRIDQRTLLDVSQVALDGLGATNKNGNAKRLVDHLQTALATDAKLANMLRAAAPQQTVRALREAVEELAVPRRSAPQQRKIPTVGTAPWTQSLAAEVKEGLFKNRETLLGRIPLADLEPHDLFVTSSGYGQSIRELEERCVAEPDAALLAWSFVPFTRNDLRAIAARSPLIRQSLRNYVDVNVPYFDRIPPEFLQTCRQLFQQIGRGTTGELTKQSNQALVRFKQVLDGLTRDQLAALNDCPAFQLHYFSRRHKIAEILHLNIDDCAAVVGQYRDIADTVLYGRDIQQILLGA